MLKHGICWNKTLTLLESSRPVELDPSQVAQELSYLIEEDKVQQIDTKIFDNKPLFRRGRHPQSLGSYP